MNITLPNPACQMPTEGVGEAAVVACNSGNHNYKHCLSLSNYDEHLNHCLRIPEQTKFTDLQFPLTRQKILFEKLAPFKKHLGKHNNSESSCCWFVKYFFNMC